MENEANARFVDQRIAGQLRRKLLQPRGRAKQGYDPMDPFVHILNSLSDEQLVAKYIAHNVIEQISI